LKFREHRGGFPESAATIVEIEDRAALVAYIQRLLASYPSAPPVKEDTVAVESYCFDERNGWDTHIVTLKGYGVIGYTDAMC